MATERGQCTNYGNCSKADSKEIVEAPAGSNLVCPECGKQIIPLPSKSGKSPVVPILIVVGLLILAGLGIKHFTGSKATPSEGNGSGNQAATSGGMPSGGAPSGVVILRLHGSNTIGSQLVPALVEAFLKKQGATSVQTVVSGTDEKTIQATMPKGVFPEGDNVAIVVQAHGSKTAFEDLATATCDIGMASRRIKDDEKQNLAAKGLGDLTSRAGEYVLGLDGVAVIVNSVNPVDTLTKKQLADMFSGAATTWNQVGLTTVGPNAGIKLLARDEKSGTWTPLSRSCSVRQP